MSTKNGWKAIVDRQGRVLLPPELAADFHFQPGEDLEVSLSPQGLVLNQPGAILRRVYIEVTNTCNLACRTCIRNIWDEPAGMMSEVIFNRILEGVRALPLTPEIFFGGFGEPLAHPNITRMVHQAKETGARVELITNGTMLDGARSRGLIEAGLDLLWVSLDGATPESYADVRLGAMLPAVIANLKGFRDARPAGHRPRPEIGVVFVAMKRNIADLPALIKLSRRLGAVHFMVTNVLPYTEEMRGEILYDHVLSEIMYLDSPWVPHFDLPRIDRNALTREPLFKAVYSGRNLSLNGDNLGQASNRCPFITKGSTAIAWDGSLAPCLPLLHDHKSFLDVRQRTVHRWEVGNLQDTNLLSLWNDSDYTAFRRRVSEFDFSPCAYCGGCDLSEENQEDCIGNQFPTCGGCLWAQGIIQCP